MKILHHSDTNELIPYQFCTKGHRSASCNHFIEKIFYDAQAYSVAIHPLLHVGQLDEPNLQKPKFNTEFNQMLGYIFQFY